MNPFNFFRSRNSAPVARDRLHVLLAHERGVVGGTDLVSTLQDEILAVIARHMSIERQQVNVKLDRGDAMSTLEIDVELPTGDKFKGLPPRGVERDRPKPPAEAAKAGGQDAKEARQPSAPGTEAPKGDLKSAAPRE